MTIPRYHLIHGAALYQLISHPAFVGLDRLDDGEYGHYRVNTDRYLFIKYSTAERPPWQFTFRPEDLARVLRDESAAPTYLGLVCGTDGVAGISAVELLTILDRESAEQQSVQVERPKGGRYRVVRGDWRIARLVPVSGFAEYVLES